MKLDSYLSFFRVAICLILLIDLFYLIPYASLIYDRQKVEFYGFYGSLFSFLRENFWFVLGFQFISILLTISGIFKNFSAFLLLISNFLLFGINMRNSVYGDDFLRINLIFFVFVSSFKMFSFKAGLPKSKFWTFLSTMALFSMVVHVSFMYLYTVFHKIMSPEWLNGSAFYKSLLFEKHLDVFGIQKYFLEQPFLAKIVNYATILYQFLLIPMVLVSKKTRRFILILTLIIHLKLALMFLLPKFQMIMILHLGLFFYWPEIWHRFRLEIQKIF